MSIEFACSGCQATIRVADQHAGKQARCPECQAVTAVPQFAANQSPAAPATPGMTGLHTNGPPAGVPVAPGQYPPGWPPAPVPPLPVPPLPVPPLQASPPQLTAYPYPPPGPSAAGGVFNPYQTPGYPPPTGFRRFDSQLASRGSRLVAALLDLLLLGAICIPGIVLLLLSAELGEELVLVAFAVSLVALFALQIFNWILISTRGQSVGKLVVGIRICGDDGLPPGFVKGVLLRIWVPALINQACLAFSLVDVLMIFGDERRCIHDMIAQTVVLEGGPASSAAAAGGLETLGP